MRFLTILAQFTIKILAIFADVGDLFHCVYKNCL